MLYPKAIAVFLTLPASLLAQETIYAAYVFHRHGDRTPKSLPPTSLTALGYDQVVQSGAYYRSRYVSNSSLNHIFGLNSGIVKNSQIAVSSPQDAVLQNSAQAFLQGLYPPVGEQKETLSNGVTVIAPFNGYQLIPIAMVSAGAGGEDNGWLQDTSNCAKAQSSSNNYFASATYQKLLSSTKDFYARLTPVVDQTFASSYMTYQNAYAVFDLINVARIHNQTIQSSDLLDDSSVQELQLLANEHEYGLAYNASDNARAVPGMQLAGDIMTFLTKAINSKGANKIGIQFGAYGPFLSFFGLAGLPSASSNFTGIPDYASSMTFEVFGPSSTSFPSASDLRIRFLFSNGSTGIYGDPQPYPLFGGSDTSMSWSDFSKKISDFAIVSTEKWCNVCGNTAGVCATTGGSSPTGGNHKANVVAGAVGALITLTIVLGLQVLIALVAGFRVVRKRNQAPPVCSEKEMDI